MSRPRALLWVQHLLGSGHLRRALGLAEAMIAEGIEVTLVSGGPPMPWTWPVGLRFVQLPPLKSSDAGFSAVVDAQGERPADAILAERRERLGALFDTIRPDVLITEMYPFGRRAFRAELLPLLDRAGAARPRPLILCSVRDVLVSKGRADRLLAMRDLVLRHYDRVLAHGDDRLLPFATTFPHAAELGDRLVHTGFIHAGSTEATDSADDVLVSAGGGAVGLELIRTAIRARPLSALAAGSWCLIGGANLPEADRRQLVAEAGPGLVLHRHVGDLPARMAAARVSVSQAGYNSVVEGLAGRARMVLVPFDAPGQDEQKLRARRLAELGLATMLDETGLDPATLAAAIDRAAAAPRPDTGHLAFDGAERSARLIRDLLADHARG